MADAADLKSAGETHEGSTPSLPTILNFLAIPPIQAGETIRLQLPSNHL